MLEDLDDEFARRLDKRSYSGDRFIRVIGISILIFREIAGTENEPFLPIKEQRKR